MQHLKPKLFCLPLICIKPNNRCTVPNTYTKHMLLWSKLKYVLHETIALFSSHFKKKKKQHLGVKLKHHCRDITTPGLVRTYSRTGLNRKLCDSPGENCASDTSQLGFCPYRGSGGDWWVTTSHLTRMSRFGWENNWRGEADSERETSALSSISLCQLI